MSPAPTNPVPLYVGGHSDPAIQRAARAADGWISAQLNLQTIRDMVAKMHLALEKNERDVDAFEIKVTPMVWASPEAMAEVFEAGVTDVITVPWMYHGDGPHSLPEKLEHLESFTAEVIRPLKGTNR